MHLQMYYVVIPGYNERRLRVPKYDLAILRAAFKADLKPGQSIAWKAAGVVEARNFHSERLRLMRDYATVPRGEDKPAWKVVYATEDAMLAAYEDARSEGEMLEAQFELQRQRAAAAAVVEDIEPGKLDALRKQVEADVRKEIGEQVRTEIEQELVGKHLDALKKEIREQLLAEMNVKPKRARGRPSSTKAKAKAGAEA